MVSPGSRRRLGHFFAFSVLTLVLFAALFTGSNFQIHAGELLFNGSFEEVAGDTPIGWSILNGSISSATAPTHSGNRSARITTAGSAPAVVRQSIPVTAGASYAASGFVRNDVPDVHVRLQIDFVAGPDGFGPTLESFLSVPIGGSNIGTEFTLITVGPILAPAGAESAQFGIFVIPPDSDPKSVHLDTFSIEESAVPTASPTPTATSTEAPVPTSTETPSPASTETPSPTQTPAANAGTPTPTPAPTAAPTPTEFPTTGGTIRITEVFINAQISPEAPLEWLELVNFGPAALQLSGYILRDNFGEDPIPEVLLGPGQRLVVRASAAAAPAAVGAAVILVDGSIGNGLANSADMLELRDASGTLIDSVNWGTADAGWRYYRGDLWHPGPDPGPEAASLARSPSDSDTDSAGDWFGGVAPSPGSVNPAAPAHEPTASPTTKPSSGTLPSPTATASPSEASSPTAMPLLPVAAKSKAAPGQVLISEVHAFGGDGPGPERDHEWVELFNPLDREVQLSGWMLRDNHVSTALPEFTIPAKGFVVVAVESLSAPEDLLSVLVGPSIGNGLANRADRITILDAAGTEIDGVSWGDDRSISDPPAPSARSGHSIARTSATLDDPGWISQTPPDPGRNPFLTDTSNPLQSGQPAASPVTPAVVGRSEPTVEPSRPRAAPLPIPTPLPGVAPDSGSAQATAPGPIALPVRPSEDTDVVRLAGIVLVGLAILLVAIPVFSGRLRNLFTGPKTGRSGPPGKPPTGKTEKG